MESKAHELSQSKGRGAKERHELRRPRNEHTELDPFAGGDRPSTTKTQSWSKDSQSELVGAATSVFQNSHSTTDHITNEAIAKPVKSELNPLASEFVPNQPVPNVNLSQQQQQIDKIGLSPYAEEFVPRSNLLHSDFKEPEEIPDYNNGIEDSLTMQALRTFLFEVTFSPEKFERELPCLTHFLNETVSDKETLEAVVDVIFEESIQEPNFRYNGAKLCNHLSQHLQHFPETEKFRTLLLKRCQAKHVEREKYATAEGRGEYLRGFALFLAELYSQLEIQKGNVKERIQSLGNAVLEVLDTLLKFPTTDNLKCACQILKCVGAYLEDQRRTSSSSDLDNIFLKLQRAVESESCSRDVRRMVSSVLELRVADWGRTCSSSSPSNDPVQDDSFHLNEPVFYGPDGLPITAEEALFLESQQLSPDYPDIDEFDDDIYGSDEMDEGIQEAYEEFLRSTNQ